MKSTGFRLGGTTPAPPPPVAGAPSLLRPDLGGRSVMVVEDEGLVALDIEMALLEAGATVAGPYMTLQEAQRAILGGARPDAVILDVNIGGEMVWPLARLLGERGLPFLFHTANGDVPEIGEFPGVTVCRKPMLPETLIAAVADVLRPRDA